MKRSSRKGSPEATRKFRLSAIVLMAALSVLSVLLGPLASGASASPRPLQSSISPGAYTALANPSRVCDTRAVGVGGSVQNQCTGKTLATGGTLDVALTGVPAGATAVEANVTVTNPAGTGFLNVYPTGAPSTTSVLDFTKGQNVANLVTVGIGTNNSITLANGPATGTGGTTDAIVDVLGYYMPQASPSSAGTYTALSPARIADTRCSASPAPSFCASEKLPAANAALPILGAAGTANIQATGVGGVPAAGVSQVLVNLTVVNPSADTFLSAYATGQPAPTAGAEFSNLNAAKGEVLAGKAIVDVNSSGQFTVFNHAGNADVVVDVEGYFSSSSGASGALFTPLASPVRVIGTLAAGATVAPGASASATVAGANAVPAGATAAALDVIDIAPQKGNFLTVYPTSATPPVASDVNWVPGNTYNVVPNAAFGTLSSTGSFSVLNGPANTANNAGTTGVDADLFGYFSVPTAAPTGLDIAVPSTTVNTFSVPADGTSTVTIDATVTHGAGGPTVAGDTVLFTVTPSTAGDSCGTFSPSNGVATTNSTGVATVTYTAPAFASGPAPSCTVTAQDGDFGQTGSGVITQTQPANTVAVTATPGAVAANGATTSQLSATVTSTTASADNDIVTFKTSGTPAAACGTIGAVSGTTGSAGTTPVTATYTASTTAGFCVVTATEANTGGSNTVTIDQKSSPEPATGTVAISATSTGAAITTASQTYGQAVTYYVTVKDANANLIVGDPVAFSMTNSVANACGSVSPTTTTTNSSGQATFTYTAGNIAGAPACTIAATDAETGATASLAVTQSAPPSVVTVTPKSDSVLIGTTDPVSVSVSNVTSADNGIGVTFAVTGTGCNTATIPAGTTLAVASGATTGTASSSYTAGSTAGAVCTFTAAVAAPVSASGSATIFQTG